MKTITVTVAKDAKVSIATDGFAGPACKEATAALEAALGQVVADTPTPEAFLDPLETSREISR